MAWLLRCYPHGTTQIDDTDDALWAAIVQSANPLTIHVALSERAALGRIAARRLPGTVHFYDAPGRMLEFIFSGVLDRFPGLRISLAGGGLRLPGPVLRGAGRRQLPAARPLVPQGRALLSRLAQ